MNNKKKIAIGLGVAGGALLAAWLLTGDRRKKTRDFIVKKANDLKQTIKKVDIEPFDDSDIHYV
ncbi:MAG: hypothetical protein JJE09_03605 [Bacteroidia bacterium]|nr:hypothetical protein [Bacteroidia bacterium]